MRRIMAVVVVGLLSVAGCSSDAPTTDAPTTDAPTTDAPSTDAPSTDAPSTDAPSTDAPSTDAGGNTQARLSDEEFCAKIDEMRGVMYAEGRVFSDLLNRLRELAKVTRDAELQEALETFIPLVEEMSKLGQDERETSTLFSMLADPNITDAGEFISNYAAENC